MRLTQGSFFQTDIEVDAPGVPLDGEEPVGAPELALDKRTGQTMLFQGGEWYESEWQGMPEFNQENLKPRKTIYVHFAKLEDVAPFAELIQQPLTTRTRAIWFPPQETWHYRDKRYVAADGGAA